jgi:predicted esterase
MSARTGNPKLAYALLDEVHETGFWFGEVLLRKSPSLLTLQGAAEFEQRVERNRLLREKDQAQQFPLLIIHSQGRCAQDMPPCPLLIGLHSNAATAQDSLDFWRAAAATDWLAAAPQSSQTMWKGAYVWNDEDTARLEVQKHYAALLQRYSLDTERVVFAGHSMGAEMAMRLAISAAIPVQGFIAIGPGGPYMDEPKQWEDLLKANPARGLRGYIIYGSEDRSIPQKNISRVVERLNRSGIPTEVECLSLVGHDFEVDYEESLLNGLNFIFQRETNV